MNSTIPGHSRWAGPAFVAPFLLAYVLLLVWPLLNGLWLSTNAIDLLSNRGRFVGLGNFVDLMQDETFVRTVGNTLLFALVYTPPAIALALALALALNRPGRLGAVLRGVFFATTVLSVTIVTLVWRLVLMPDRGMLWNLTDGASGAPLNQPWLALPTLAIITLWWVVGLPMMLFLAALQQIPADLYEAAALDNASRWGSFRAITLPSLRRTLVLVGITQLIGALQVFGQVILLTNGGPNNSTRSMVMFIYEALFDQWAVGYAAAGSQVLFLFLLVSVAMQRWADRKLPEVRA